MKIVYSDMNVGLGDLIFGFMSCFYLSKILDCELYIEQGPLLDIFDYPICSTELKFDILNAEIRPDWWIKLKTLPLESIFYTDCSIKTGQNIALAFYENPFCNKKMYNLCPDKTEMVKVFFENVKLTQKAQEEIKDLNFSNRVGIHFRSAKKYSGESFVIRNANNFIQVIKDINSPLLVCCDDFDVIQQFKNYNSDVITISQTTPPHLITNKSSCILAFKEIWALGTCKSLVISFWSNFSRIACLRTKCPTTLVELDIDTSYDNSSYWVSLKLQQNFNYFTSFNITPFTGNRLTDWNELLTKHSLNISI
jgi:hypothetical protein